MAKIKATTPVVKEAVVAQTFDYYWMKEFHCQSNPNGKTSVRATLIACRDDVDDNGDPVRRLGGNRKQIQIPDVFARIEADPAGLVAQAFGALTNAIIAEDDEFVAEA